MSDAFGLIAAEHVTKAAPQVRAIVDRAAKYRHRDWAALEPELVDGKSQLWAGAEATDNGPKVRFVVLTELQKRPLGLVAVIVYVAGHDLKRWLPHLATIEEWASGQDCVAIDCWCREGIEKHLSSYRRRAVLMTKGLRDAEQ